MPTSTAGDTHQRTGVISRRRLLGGAAGFATVGGLGAAGGALLGRSGRALAAPEQAAAHAGAAAVVKSPPATMFPSRPDLLPPRLQVTDLGADTAPGYLLLTPSAVPGARGVTIANQIAAGLGQPGVMIADQAGNVVFFKPTTALATNLQVQTYRNAPVLTYWEGAMGPGMGFGKGYVLDSSYRQVAVVKAGNGLQADLHELTLTPQGTALITAYSERVADLSSINGPKNGSVYDCAVQEVDVATGKVLLDWRALDHVPVSETHAALGKPPFDYFHVNSIEPYGADELLVSSRNTWTLYRINRRTGAIVARIGGKSSDYLMGAGTSFYWQHDARPHAGGVVSLFDDGAAPPEEARSRALVLAVDEAARRVELTKAFTHPANLLAQFEGSVQLLPDGGAFVGWGGVPYFSQFAADGALTLDGRFPTNDQSYRAYRGLWTGTPASPPDVALQGDAIGSTAVYVSWNGDTRTHRWQVLSGKAANALEPIATVQKAGFETAITVRPEGKYLAVAALDASGRRLAVSRTLTA